MRTAFWVLALAATAAVTAGAGHRQSGPRWLAYDGRQWAQFAPREKQAYVAGFLAGAAYGSPAGARVGPDTAEVRRIVDSLARTSTLRFPFGHMVYANQLDEFYWWDNHVPVPIYVALWSINQRLVGGGATGRGGEHDP